MGYDFFLQSSVSCFAFTGCDGEDRRSAGIAAAPVNGSLVKEGGELVVFLLGDRVIFVVVAAATIKGESQPHRAGGLGHIHDVVDAVLLGDSSAFAIDGMITQEAGSKALLRCGVGQKIACKLPNGEVIPRDVAIKGVDNPVSPRPHGTFAIALITVGVGIASSVEPWPGHALTIGRVGKEAVDELVVSVGSPVIEKCSDFFRTRRQATKIEREAADEGGSISSR